MSVIKNKRNESSVEFINTARTLNIFTIRQCTKFPKRYTFYVSQDIVKCSNDIYKYVVMANDIYPVNKHEALVRKDLILLAEAQCEALISKICIAIELFSIEEKYLIEWMQLIEDEQRLLKGLKKKDKERFSNLPDIRVLCNDIENVIITD